MPSTGKITLDGKLDEPDWQRAPVSADFIENMPREKQPARDRAEVRVLYDKDAIYFGVRGFDADQRRFMRLSCDATKYLARWTTSSCG